MQEQKYEGFRYESKKEGHFGEVRLIDEKSWVIRDPKKALVILENIHGSFQKPEDIMISKWAPDERFVFRRDEVVFVSPYSKRLVTSSGETIDEWPTEGFPPTKDEVIRFKEEFFKRVFFQTKMVEKRFKGSSDILTAYQLFSELPASNMKRYLLSSVYGLSVLTTTDDDGSSVSIKMRRFKKGVIKKQNLLILIDLFYKMELAHLDVKTDNIMSDDEENSWFIDIDNLIMGLTLKKSYSDNRFYHSDPTKLTLSQRRDLDKVLVKGLS